MACHIAAAAGGLGARRYVKGMTKAQRTSINNGVWMCYTHGKLVDTDEHRFTIPMLKKWRKFAEFRAKCRQEYGADKPLPQEKLLQIGFADHALQIKSLGDETQTIGNATQDSCVSVIWGKELCHAVRDVLVEIVRNTFIHGKAKKCLILIRNRSIHVTDDGSDFNWLKLHSNKAGRGGAAAVRHIIEQFGDRLVLGSKRHKDENRTIIALAHTLDDIALVSPCSVEVEEEEWETIRKRRQIPASWFSSKTEPCKIFYIVLPEFMPHSDAILLSEALQPEAIKDKQIVFVTKNTSTGVRSYLLHVFPFARVLNISNP